MVGPAAGKEELRRLLSRDAPRAAGVPDVVEVADWTGWGGDAPPAVHDLALYVVTPAAISENGVDRVVGAMRRLPEEALLMVAGPGGSPAWRQALTAGLPEDLTERVVFLEEVSQAEVEHTLAGAIVRTLPGLQLALPRRLPALRHAASREIILETSKANAQFALMSNLPANVPIIGAAVGDMADFLVLTKNQALMIIKLSAVYGRPMDSMMKLGMEISPVVGNAFAWRTAARMIIGLLPTPVAAVPKTAIAYVGTYVVGAMAAFYFDSGRRPPKEMMESIRREAMGTYQRVYGPIQQRLGKGRAKHSE